MYNLGDDHTAASDILPSLFPLSIFSKLASATDDLTAQSSPAVILEGLTIYKSLLATVLLQAPAIYSLPPQPEVFAGITPAVICLDPADQSPTAKATLLVSNLVDCMGDKLLGDMQGTLSALKKQFGRPVTTVQGCLPQGRYAMNLVYGTGQAWSDPNEAGVCAASELPVSADGKSCTGAVTTQGATLRARLPSQDVVLTIGPPSDASYCKNNKTPPACCPLLSDGSDIADPTQRIDPSGQCKCPNDDPKNPKWSCL